MARVWRRRRRGWLAVGLGVGTLGVFAVALPQRPPPVVPAAAPGPPATVAAESAATAPAGPPPAAALYRWRDSRGGVHLTSQPPPSGVHAEVIPIGGPAPPTASTPPAPSAAGTTPGPSAPAGAVDLAGQPLEVYTPRGLQELVDRLGEARRQMEDRDRILERLQEDLQR